MTIDDFMKNYKLRNKETVINWIKEDLIPGAKLDKDYLPASARPPYTNARAKSANAIYYSIVNATRKRHHVLPKLYNICPEEFNGYIDRLVAADLIVIRKTDGITYYDATLTGMNSSKKFILDAIEACSRGIAQGTTNAMLQHASAGLQN